MNNEVPQNAEVPTPKVVSRIEFLALERAAMVDENSFWLTGTVIDRPPTREDCIWRFIESGAPERFRLLFTYDPNDGQVSA